jgi:hypothetical protein
VIGDGDWVVAINYAFANKIAVNPDATTYANTINLPSQDDDYINSVKELIKSQKTGYTVPLDEVIDERTGKKINQLMVQLHGHLVIRWHLMLYGFTDVVSTKDFVNQMATTLVGVKEWALLHDKEVISIF